MDSDNQLITLMDKAGVPFQLGSRNRDDARSLRDMYDLFTPKKMSQGLPPEGSEARRQWIDCLLQRAENFLAWRDDSVIGHAALLADFSRNDAEFLIFILNSHRGRGVGTELTKTALRRASHLKLGTVWLAVEGHNMRAIGLYKKFGFEFCPGNGWERSMVLRLQAER